VVGQGGVLSLTFGACGTDVDGCFDQFRDVVQQPVVGLDGHGVGLDHGERGVDGDPGFGADPVSDPAEPDGFVSRHKQRQKPPTSRAMLANLL
jgi:hypothetical protein